MAPACDVYLFPHSTTVMSTAFVHLAPLGLNAVFRPNYLTGNLHQGLLCHISGAILMQLCSTPNAPVYPSSLSDVLKTKKASD